MAEAKRFPAHREWRGVRDTACDFVAWARLWGLLLAAVGKAPRSACRMALRYRWAAAYLHAHGYADSSTRGQRGAALRESHRRLYEQLRDAAEQFALLTGRGGRSRPIVLYDGENAARIVAEFPTLAGVPYQLLPVRLAGELDPDLRAFYLDAAERFGIPASVSAELSAVCGAIITDALPRAGACLVTESAALSPYLARRFPALSVFHLDAAAGEEEARRCARFIEETTGAKRSRETRPEQTGE